MPLSDLMKVRNDEEYEWITTNFALLDTRLHPPLYIFVVFIIHPIYKIIEVDILTGLAYFHASVSSTCMKLSPIQGKFMSLNHFP